MNDMNPTELFSGQGRYVLEVRCDSMIDIGIMDGDYVVIQQQNSANNGDIVVALINREEATLKRLINRPGGRIELRPENTAMLPEIYAASQIEVQGKMVGLFRSY